MTSLKNKKKVKLWESVEKKKAAADEAARQKLSALKEKRKTLLLLRQNVASFKNKLENAVIEIKNRHPQKALTALLSISKDSVLSEYSQRTEFLISMFYIYKYTGIHDKMMELSESCYIELEFIPEHYDILYEIAICNENYGDPEIAKKIYKSFINNLELNYKDVSARYNNML